MRSAILASLLLIGCTATAPPETSGEANAPLGYHLHCNDNPDSVFCEQTDD